MATIDTTIQTKEELIEWGAEDIWINILNLGIDGVMFHNFQVDLFTLLELDGFVCLHQHQVEEETEEFNENKDIYIKEFKKLPITNTKINYWKHSTVSTHIPNEEVARQVKLALHEYLSRESYVVERLREYRRQLPIYKNRVQFMITDTLSEIEFVESIISCLEEDDFSYESVCNMSCMLYNHFY